MQITRWQRFRTSLARGRNATWSALRRLAVATVELFSFRDLLLLGGAALVGFGLHDVYPPAALIVPGSVFLSVAIFGVR